MKRKEVSGVTFSPPTTDLMNLTDEKAASVLAGGTYGGTDASSHVQEADNRTVPFSILRH